MTAKDWITSSWCECNMKFPIGHVKIGRIRFMVFLCVFHLVVKFYTSKNLANHSANCFEHVQAALHFSPAQAFLWQELKKMDHFCILFVVFFVASLSPPTISETKDWLFSNWIAAKSGRNFASNNPFAILPDQPALVEAWSSGFMATSSLHEWSIKLAFNSHSRRSRSRCRHRSRSSPNCSCSL